MFRFSAFACVVVAVVLTASAPAFAGQLFPPDNLPNPHEDCPNGEVLSWLGSRGTVVCIDPTLGVTTANCSDGKIMVGISNGAPVCQTFAHSAGGVDVVYKDDVGTFGYCRLSWGAVTSCGQNGVTCSTGDPQVTTMSHDVISSGEDQSEDKSVSSGSTGAQINHVECLVQ